MSAPIPAELQTPSARLSRSREQLRLALQGTSAGVGADTRQARSSGTTWLDTPASYPRRKHRGRGARQLVGQTPPESHRHRGRQRSNGRRQADRPAPSLGSRLGRLRAGRPVRLESILALALGSPAGAVRRLGTASAVGSGEAATTRAGWFGKAVTVACGARSRRSRSASLVRRRISRSVAQSRPNSDRNRAAGCWASRIGNAGSGALGSRHPICPCPASAQLNVSCNWSSASTHSSTLACHGAVGLPEQRFAHRQPETCLDLAEQGVPIVEPNICQGRRSCRRRSRSFMLTILLGKLASDALELQRQHAQG